MTPGRDVLDQQVERLGRQPAGPAHALECLRPVQGGLAAASAIELRGVVLIHR